MARPPPPCLPTPRVKARTGGIRFALTYTVFAVGTACSVYTGIKAIVFDFEGVAGAETAMAPFLAASIATINFQACRPHNPYPSLMRASL
jgi:hypothetical protein